jgi:hypothetical protein
VLQVSGVGYEAGETYHLSPYELMELPSIQFHLAQGVMLEMTPDRYMEHQGKVGMPHPVILS